MLRVTHCNNLAGVSSTLVKYQRRLGVQSQLIVKVKHPNKYELETVRGLYGGLLSLAADDVIHYHYSTWYTSMLNIPNFDARLLRRLGKRIVMHYHGDDLRKGKRIPIQFSHTFVSTPDLLDYSPDSEWLPNPVDLEMFTPLEGQTTGVYRVGYYDPPPWSGYVDTQKIEFAIQSLRREGFRVEGAPAKGIPHHGMPAYYHSITIWVDKLEAGAYSLMACEAATSGIPVIASTSNVAAYIGQEPFYEFSDNVTEDLRYMLEDEVERRRIAQRGRDYVEARHEASRVAERTVKVYSSIL